MIIMYLKKWTIKDKEFIGTIKDKEFIESKWIVTEKIIDEEQVVKARLLAKGFQERNKDNLHTDSPTCTKENVCIMSALAATNSWKVKSLDMKSAYLQGKEIEWLVYVKPPRRGHKR